MCPLKSTLPLKSNSASISIEKSNSEEKPDNVIKGRFKIMKSDDDKMLAFGWANVSMRVDGELIEDWQALFPYAASPHILVLHPWPYSECSQSSSWDALF